MNASRNISEPLTTKADIIIMMMNFKTENKKEHKVLENLNFVFLKKT